MLILLYIILGNEQTPTTAKVKLNTHEQRDSNEHGFFVFIHFLFVFNI